MQPIHAGSIRHEHLQAALSAAQRTEVRNRPRQPRQSQQRLHKAGGLSQGQAKQVLEGQAELDGCI